jgi:hypothetical protein
VTLKCVGKTSQDRQIFIFSFQFFRTEPSQIVPFINQQRFPALNSHAGQFAFWSGEHFFIAQHGFARFLFSAILETKKNICRSTEGGTERHSCS